MIENKCYKITDKLDKIGTRLHIQLVLFRTTTFYIFALYEVE